ncbi:MAG: 30S ribosomal protein S9, partial [Chloroflexota bacterium]|nr:30S ribosomal protein S9 [Chloroflexota bacterium]
MNNRYYEGIGRRKEASARVRLMQGSGTFIVNDKEIEEYFTRLGDVPVIIKAFDITDQSRNNYDVTVLVN